MNNHGFVCYSFDADSRNERDFYATPLPVIKEFLDVVDFSACKTVLEPACGEYAISNELEARGFQVTSKDIVYGNNFLTDDYTNEHYDLCITNPPFCNFNQFVHKGKEVADTVCLMAPITYFKSGSRFKEGVWNNLSDIYVYDQPVNFDKNKSVFSGLMVAAWFVWKKDYDGDARFHIIDVYKKYGKSRTLQTII